MTLKMEVNDFLTQQGAAGALSHAKTTTVQEVYDAMSEEQKDLVALLAVSAADDVDIPGEVDLQKTWKALSTEQKNVVDFIVGGVVVSQSIKHEDDMFENFLAHFGVKGMKWGVRKREDSSSALSKRPGAKSASMRKYARDNVKAGTASLGTAHIAALKTKGHRLANGFLGDKRFWKTTLAVAGFTVAGIGVTLLAPSLMPTAALASIGTKLAGTSGIGGHLIYPLSSAFGTPAKVPSIGTFGMSTARDVGVDVVEAIIGSGVVISAAGTQVGALATNTVRAVRGNARINKSFERLGSEIYRHQSEGTKSVRKILSMNGSLREKDLKPKEEAGVQHDALSLDNFLSHFGVKGMKWGIRRDRDSSGGGGKSAKKEEKDERKANDRAKASLANMKAGSVVTMLDADGNPKTMVKKKDGSWQETFLSADAERLVRTAQKEGHELSTREVQEAVNRANAIANYQKTFGGDPNANLRAQVDAMRLQKEYSEMKAAMTPQRKSAVAKLVGATSTAYGAYSKLDKAVGGELSKQLGGKVAEKFDPTGFATKAAKDALKDKNDMTLSTAKAQKAMSEAAKADAEAHAAVLKLKQQSKS